MRSAFLDRIEMHPIIAAVKEDEGLSHAIETECEIIFILYGDVCRIPAIVDKVKSSGKLAMVHIDLITGLNTSKDIAVDFIKENTRADGIITTKGNLIGRARELGLYTVLRYFVIDSMALKNIAKQDMRGMLRPDVIEILPGIVLPKVIKKIREVSRVPVLAGGLISDREDVMNALNNGILAISTTNEDVWKL